MEEKTHEQKNAVPQHEQESLDLILDFEIEELESRVAFAKTGGGGGLSCTVATTCTPTWNH
ncbi:MAG TPA: hypothetical protein VGD98_15450 [Ktedonobacteraceae bacterium]